MTYETIVSTFATEDRAKAATHALEEEGFSAADISIVGQQALGSSHEVQRREPGFWKRLFGGEVREHDAGVLGAAIEAGPYVLTARVPKADADRAAKVVQKYNPVNLRETADQDEL